MKSVSHDTTDLGANSAEFPLRDSLFSPSEGEQANNFVASDAVSPPPHTGAPKGSASDLRHARRVPRRTRPLSLRKTREFSHRASSHLPGENAAKKDENVFQEDTAWRSVTLDILPKKLETIANSSDGSNASSGRWKAAVGAVITSLLLGGMVIAEMRSRDNSPQNSQTLAGMDAKLLGRGNPALSSTSSSTSMIEQDVFRFGVAAEHVANLRRQAEAERLAAERAEAERLAAERAEAERLAAERAEAERLAAEAAAREAAKKRQQPSETSTSETSAAVPAGNEAIALAWLAERGGVNDHLKRIAKCESGGNPRAISSTGKYRGKYQFSMSTWRSVGGTGDPAQASEAEQDMRAQMLYDRSGPGQWPVCSKR